MPRRHRQHRKIRLGCKGRECKGLTFCGESIINGGMLNVFRAQSKRRKWWHGVLAGQCVASLFLAGVTLCFCTHEEACDEGEAHSAECDDVCLVAESAHDHVTVETPDVVLAEKKVGFGDEVFGGGRGFDFGVAIDVKKPPGFRGRERGDDHAVALVMLTRRLC